MEEDEQTQRKIYLEISPETGVRRPRQNPRDGDHQPYLTSPTLSVLPLSITLT